MHPSTDVWLAAYQFDDMPEPELWHPGEPVPQRIVDHAAAGGIFRAHNAAFERLITQYVTGPRYGWPIIPLRQWEDSAAEAAAMSLPRALGQLAKVLGVPHQKDDEGHNLMLRMARPRSYNEDGTPVWWDVPERIARLGSYCQDDVRSEKACSAVLRRLSVAEREIYYLTEEMNDRGMRIDRELVLAAKDVADLGVEHANARILEITDGAVLGVTKLPSIKQWLVSQGVQFESLDKDTVKDMLDDPNITEKVREMLELRAAAGRTSLGKLDSMLTTMCVDDRVRGMLMYHGAGTGRWTGKLVQPHNFTRGEVDDIEEYIPYVLEREYSTLEMFRPPTVIISSMLRSMITAAPGKMLVAADYSGIEARVLNWLAQQLDILQLFREGKDVYKYNASRLYKVPVPDVTKMQRQGGKFQELGCGFGMGWKKAISGADTAQYGYLKLTEETAKYTVDNYRETHDKVPLYWKDAARAVIEAVRVPMTPVKIGPLKNVTAIRAGNYLYLVLPSGRPLVYPSPKIELTEAPWGEMVEQVTFWGVNAKTRQWDKQRLYGGLITENIVQAVARDVMAEGKIRAQAAGYTPVMSVHDEVITEVDADFGSAKELENILSILPPWATGLPVAAEGWKSFRYRK
jgi:DNA polymerase